MSEVSRVAKLSECCRLIRSKNAGAFWLTFDVMFKDSEIYRHVKDSGQFDADRVRSLFPGAGPHLKFFYCDAASAVKFSYPRLHSSGSPFDNDVFGGQQYAPLLDLEISLP